MPEPEVAIHLAGVGKRYLFRQQKQMFTARLFHPFRRGSDYFWALEGIDLEVARGETLGIIGPNGSGKSTLLKILSGVTAPTVGDLKVRGRVSSLLELGAGFHPYLTGRENIFLNGSLLGMTQKEIDKRLDPIIEFSGIRPFIDTPVKDYSSGMYLRLAFAVAAHSEPDILILDEVMAVGDEDFQKRSIGWIRSFREAGRTIVFVSHEMRAVSSICDRVLLLDGGRIRLLDSTDKVIRYYLRTVGRREAVAMLRQGERDAVFNSGQIALFFQGREQTLGYGLATSFRCRGLYYASSGASWRVLKRDAAGALARGEWAGTGISQTWRFGFDPDGQFDWEVATAGDGSPVQAENLNANLYLTPAYDTYLTPQEEGAIPAISPEEREDRQVSAWLPGRARIILSTGGTDVVPALEIEIPDRDLNPSLAVLNGGFGLGARIVRVSSVVDTRRTPLAADDRLSFRLRIRTGVAPAEVADLREHYRHQRILPLAGLDWEFRAGRGVIAGPDGEWTTGLATYTSLRVEEGWFDSSMGEWEVRRPAAGRLEAHGRFPLLHAIQHWLLAVLDDGGLDWLVEFDCEAPLVLSRLQANLMLAPWFRHYHHPSGDGVLPEAFRSDIGEDWEVVASCPLAAGGGASLSPAAAGGVSPEVGLVALTAPPDARLNVLNSDDKASGRLVQWLRRDVTLPAGCSVAFEGIIRVRR